jgi:hypothetical protein
MIIRFKTLETKTSTEPERISGKTYSTSVIDELLENLICRFVLTRLGKPAFEQPVPEVVRRGCQFT